MFLSVLLILYLVDFFKILYTEQQMTQVTLRETVQPPTDEAGPIKVTIGTNNSISTSIEQGSDAQKEDSGEPIPAPEVNSEQRGQLTNSAQGMFSTSTDKLSNAPSGTGTGAPSIVSSDSSSDTSSSSWRDSSSSLSSSSDSLPGGSSATSAGTSFSSSSSFNTDSSQTSGGGGANSVYSSGMSNSFQQQQQQQQPQHHQNSNDGFNSGGEVGISNRESGLNGDGGNSGMAGVANGVTGVNEAVEELKLPMNRNIPELFIPANTGVLPTDSVKSYYRQLAKSYLSTFRNGIYRQLHFDILRRRTYALTPPGANKGVQSMLFQIIGGKVYLMDPYEVPRNSKPFYRTRINEVIWILSKLATEGRIKNTEFLMSIHDCVQTVNQPHTYRGAHYQESNPSFTIVNCNFSNNIPFPMWEGSRNRDGGFSGWDSQMQEYAQDDTSWDKKIPKAVFRGGNRPSMYFRNKSDADRHCDDVGRTKLLHLSKIEPELLDISIGGKCGRVHTQLERLEPKEHHKFKYILYAEGNCMWADRTRQQVFGPSLIIKQETPCGQFFEPLMKPFTHYIPTDFFFSDTIDKVKWAKDHDEEAKGIVRNSNEFAHNFLTLKGIESYVEVLLEEYTALLVEPDIKLETGAMDVTNKRV